MGSDWLIVPPQESKQHVYLSSTLEVPLGLLHHVGKVADWN